ncbi:diguanylate cyclase domain-containing protein [Acidovorax sp. 100]|uniref:diguanylate cyclase domain-containing protein n=1 Tax=Acidovorax sp. 100 TaxID=2135635 RepID=UPI00351198AE
MAWLGGDDFGMLLPQIGTASCLACVAGKVKTTVNQSSWLDGQEIFVSGSVGVAVYPTDREVVEELLKYQIRRCTPPNAQSATTSFLPQGPDGARPTAADP